MSYESPIKLITDLSYKIIEDQESNIYKAVCSYGIDISKDELFKLLYNDRKQYDKGYSDGYAKATAEAEPVKHGRWIPVTNGRGGFECSVCTNYAPSYQDGVEWLSRFCPNCGAKMDLDEVENEKTRSC